MTQALVGPKVLLTRLGLARVPAFALDLDLEPVNLGDGHFEWL